MHVSIDQSPRIENWTKDSVIAFANSQKKAVILPSTLKRECLAVLKIQGTTEATAKWMILAAGIVVLLRYHLTQINQITLDPEFDRTTMLRLRNWLYRKLLYEWRVQKIPPRCTLEDIHITSLGRKHQAHLLAYGIATGRRKPKTDIRVRSREILPLLKK